MIDSCRTCLKKSSEMRPMSSQWNNELNFSDMLVDITGDTKDLLNVPENICIQCQDGLSDSYSFKKMCLESRDMLRRWVSEAEQNLAEEEITDCLPIEFKQSEIGNHSNAELDHIAFTDRSKPSNFNYVGQLPSVKDNVECSEPRQESTKIKFEEITVEDTVADNQSTTTDDEDEIDEKESQPVKKKRPRSSLQRHCLMCQIKFEDNKTYQKHHRAVHWPRTVCPECGKLVSKFDMRRHMRAHSHPNEHLCPECGKSFTRSENLKAHLRIHTKDKRYKCEHCGEQFIHWNSKRSHIRAVHTGEKK